MSKRSAPEPTVVDLVEDVSRVANASPELMLQMLIVLLRTQSLGVLSVSALKRASATLFKGLQKSQYTALQTPEQWREAFQRQLLPTLVADVNLETRLEVIHSTRAEAQTHLLETWDKHVKDVGASMHLFMSFVAVHMDRELWRETNTEFGEESVLVMSHPNLRVKIVSTFKHYNGGGVCDSWLSSVACIRPRAPQGSEDEEENEYDNPVYRGMEDVPVRRWPADVRAWLQERGYVRQEAMDGFHERMEHEDETHASAIEFTHAMFRMGWLLSLNADDKTRVPAGIQSKCDACGAEPAKLLACSACMKTAYCNAQCQSKHWKTGHASKCK